MAEDYSGPLDRLRDTLSYPAFNPSFVPVEVDENTVHLRIGPWTGPVYTLRDADESSHLTAFVDRIDGETHVEDLLRPLSEQERIEVANILLTFAEKNVVYDRSEQDGELWPHLTLRTRFSARERRRLDDLAVTVVNCGRIGTQVAADLAELGVGEVGIVQPVPSATNQLPESDRVFDFGTDSTDAAIEAADFVVYGTERPYPGIAATINEVANETGTPWTSVQIHGLDGLIGPTVFPGETACYRCFQERSMANISQRESYRRFLEHLAANDDVTQPRTPAFGRMLAGYATMDLVHVLSFGTGYTAGRVFVVNSLDLSIDCNDVLKLPRCDACGKDAGDAHNRFVTFEDRVEASNLIDREERR